MKKSIVTLAAIGTMWAVAAFGQTSPSRDPAPGQKFEQRQGKKLGPQDGKGPIHTPGTGGGTGAGRRTGRK
jgi:hypothetical protein